MPRRGRIVEFTGAPGSGKSTLAERCTELLRERGLRVPQREAVRDLYLRHGWVGRLAGAQVREREVAGQRLEYFKDVETPFLLWRFRSFHRAGWRRYREALAEIRERDGAAAETLERWVERSILTWLMLRSQARRMDLFLWEEGIAHRAMNLFADPQRALDEAALQRFLRAWVFPDVLVHVESEPDGCCRRMAARGLPERLVGRSQAEVRAFVESGARVARAIRDEARRRRLPVFEVSNRYPSAAALRAAPACEELARDLAGAVRAAPRSGA
jgi:energy-coupling factor transporter ATP-binding protein EcfA2